MSTVDFTVDSDSEEEEVEGIDLVTPRVGSSITNSNARNTSSSADLGRLLPNRDGKSKVWKHYKRYENNRNVCVCNHCEKLITITKGSTTGLKSHLKTKHNEVYRSEIQEEADNAVEERNSNGKRPSSSILNFTTVCPDYEESLVDWVADTYQPIRACLRPSYRRMMRASNPKCPIVGKDLAD
mmetsp:Transcript_32512/g.54805  ORF Transcript_32512/g.54805 Transcript_32512/m.54805 type:complete len:183 (+) Transcript_32512:39-587(+)